MTQRIRVVLAEDHALVREGVVRLLADTGQVEVVAAVGDVDRLLDAVRDHRPDAVLTDIRMPGLTDGIAAAHAIRAEHPGTGVVVLTQHADEHYAYQLFRHGTNGLAYLLKERVGHVDELVDALRQVVAGRSVVDPRIVEVLLAGRHGQHDRAGQRLALLTTREAEVLRIMAEGKTNRAIAQRLSLAESTVEKHVNATFAKLGLGADAATDQHRRVAAVLTFLQHHAPGP